MRGVCRLVEVVGRRRLRNQRRSPRALALVAWELPSIALAVCLCDAGSAKAEGVLTVLSDELREDVDFGDPAALCRRMRRPYLPDCLEN